MLNIRLTSVLSVVLCLALAPFGSCDDQEPLLGFRDAVCVAIEDAISTQSRVYYPGSYQYLQGISHSSRSSSANSACSVEPGTAQDVSTILKIVGATRTPFAVKGGGHASNPGFSSTTGVHIAMSRFNNVTYHGPESQTVTFGAGLFWDQVYEALEPYAVNVVGGRVTGVGVAGFTLGGGYSWLSNQHGLTIDTVVAYELVLPNGTITTVTPSHEDLFFALKGGFNNYGIVTHFTLKTFPQTHVWGGIITITSSNIDAVSAAVAKFCEEVTDPKAAVITAYNYFLGSPGVSQLLFYDGPNPPAGIFDDFLAIPYLTRDVKTRTFLSLVKAAPADVAKNMRGTFNSVSITGFSPSLLDAIVNQTSFWGSHLASKSSYLISYDVEPFLPTLFTHSSSPSAYPPASARSRGVVFPLIMYFTWNSAIFDDVMHDATRGSAAFLKSLAIAEGQDVADAPLYGNYALVGTPLENIYGENLRRLRAIKKVIDPDNVMGLAGGWKF